MLTTVDGKPLKEALAHAQSRAKRCAFLLVLPLLAFIIVSFIFPIGQMLYKSVNNTGFTISKDFGTGVSTPIMTNLAEWFEENPQGTDPDETAYAALAADLVVLRELKAPGQAGTRINYELSGSRSMFTKAARKAKKLEPPFKEAIIDLDEDWADPSLWQAMRTASSAVTVNFYLAALDRKRADDGSVEMVPENRQVYVTLFKRTLILSLMITVICF
ncbi:MAG: ABC transporter permease, partial [Planktotalea sp.]|nr:ABC transporter permease [Planktotalea sp.]